MSKCDETATSHRSSFEVQPGPQQQEEAAAEIERLRGLVLEVLDYWDSGNWRILYVQHMRSWRKRALDTLGPIAQEEAAKVAADRSSRPASTAVVVSVPIASVRV